MTIRYLDNYFPEELISEIEAMYLASGAGEATSISRKRSDDLTKKYGYRMVEDASETVSYRIGQPEAWSSAKDEFDRKQAESAEFFEKNRARNRARVEIAAAAMKNAHAERDAAIRESRDAGLPITQISEAAGMTRKSIYAILDRA